MRYKIGDAVKYGESIATVIGFKHYIFGAMYLIKVGEDTLEVGWNQIEPVISFDTYECFLKWVYEFSDSIKERLNHTFTNGFIIKNEPGTAYKKAIDCLRAHEE